MTPAWHSWCFCVLPGLSWHDKVTALRAKMTERKISWFAATALDEIACMLFFLYFQSDRSLFKWWTCWNILVFYFLFLSKSIFYPHFVQTAVCPSHPDGISSSADHQALHNFLWFDIGSRSKDPGKQGVFLHIRFGALCSLMSSCFWLFGPWLAS